METSALKSGGKSITQTEISAYSKVSRRLIPFLFLSYIFCFLDRVNMGFAKLQMQPQLGFSDTVYGLAAGIFFIGYFIFEVPSNLFLEKIGARRWIARIMITWGIVSSLTMLVSSATTFYILRFLLGLMEAGFFPGIILYLTYWYPAKKRAHITALFMAAIPVSGLIGGPLSGWILESGKGVLGLAGWQWLFLLEGLPSLILGLVTLWYLDDGIAASKWLNGEEKKVLQDNLDIEKREKNRNSLRDGLLEWRVWVFCLVYFCFCAGIYGFMFWMPQMIKNSGITNAFTIGLLIAVPNAVTVIGMIWAGRSSDRMLERRWHIMTLSIIAALGLALSGEYGASTLAAVFAVSLGLMGVQSSVVIFWSVPTALLAGTASAGGIALVNSVGNLSGFVSPYLLGYIMDKTHSLALGLYSLSALMILGGVLVMIFGPRRAKYVSPDIQILEDRSGLEGAKTV